MNYFKILYFLERGNKNLFDVSIAEQKAFMETLDEPKNDIDRSYNQYLCQNFFVPRFKIIAFNVIFAFVPPLLLLAYLIKGCFVKHKYDIEAIASMKLSSGYFPTSITNEYNTNDEEWGSGQSLKIDDFNFCLKILRKWIKSPYFVCKSMVYVAVYSDMIHKYAPKVLLSHCEFSFSSSVLTSYCEGKGIKHINTMHGEKLFYIRDSFFRFHQCYVWDNHYVDLFISMNAEPSQFRVFTPKSLKFDSNKYIDSKHYAFYKYYLQICDENELRQIIKILRSLESESVTFKLRPHPDYTDMKLLHKLIDEDHIEDPSKVSIEESISNTRYVIGSYTSVLNQAFYSGRTAVLDDVVFLAQYKKLSDRQYILTKKEVLLFSKLINK